MLNSEPLLCRNAVEVCDKVDTLIVIIVRQDKRKNWNEIQSHSRGSKDQPASIHSLLLDRLVVVVWLNFYFIVTHITRVHLKQMAGWLSGYIGYIKTTKVVKWCEEDDGEKKKMNLSIQHREQDYAFSLFSQEIECKCDWAVHLLHFVGEELTASVIMLTIISPPRLLLWY